MEPREGWEGSFLYKAEVTPGTFVVPDTALGYIKTMDGGISAGIEEEGAVGTYKPISLEEGVIEAGGSVEILPVSAANVNIGARSSGILPSHSIILSDGSSGKIYTGAKINQIRGNIDAGGRLRLTMDWMALSGKDNAHIAAVIPTNEVFGWHELVHPLAGEAVSIEFSINHNCRRVPVIIGSSTTMPVLDGAGPATLKRTPYRIREGRQSVTMTYRFIGRPSQSTIDGILTELASSALVFTGLGAGAPTLTFTFTNGKPNRVSQSLAEASEASWPLELIYKDWSCS